MPSTIVDASVEKKQLSCALVPQIGRHSQAVLIVEKLASRITSDGEVSPPIWSCHGYLGPARCGIGLSDGLR